MSSFLQRWVTPRSADARSRRREVLLYILTLSGVGASLVWLLAGLVFVLLTGPTLRLLGDVIVGLEGLFFGSSAYLLARRGRLFLASCVALLGLLAMQVSSMLLIWRSPIDPTVAFYAVIIALGGLLLGRRGAIVFYVLSLSSYIVTATALFLLGRNQTEVIRAPTLVMMTTMLALILAILLQVVHFYIRSMEQALSQAEEEVRERTGQLEVAYRDLAQQHTRLDVILRNVADGLVVTDLEDRVIVVNPVFAAILGRPAGDLMTRPLGQVLANEALLDIVVQARERPAVVFSVNIPLAESVYQASACALVGVDHSIQGVVTVLHDITQEIEAIEARTQFVSAVAHELRVPLSSIRGFGDLLRSGVGGPVSDEQHSYVEAIHRSAECMNNLVHDLLDLCRLESGRARVEVGPTSLRGAVSEVCALLGPQLQEKRISLEVDMPADTPLVLADPYRLNQILVNLIANAWCYTPEGGQIAVLSRLLLPPQADVQRCPSKDTAYVEVAVRDTGIGIPPEHHERIFEQFVRLDHPMVEQAQGTGLGLTITRQLLHVQGGRIWVESALGEGSTFYFTLPVVA